MQMSDANFDFIPSTLSISHFNDALFGLLSRGYSPRQAHRMLIKLTGEETLKLYKVEDIFEYKKNELRRMDKKAWVSLEAVVYQRSWLSSVKESRNMRSALPPPQLLPESFNSPTPSINHLLIKISPNRVSIHLDDVTKTYEDFTAGCRVTMDGRDKFLAVVRTVGVAFVDLTRVFEKPELRVGCWEIEWKDGVAGRNPLPRTHLEVYAMLQNVLESTGHLIYVESVKMTTDFASHAHQILPFLQPGALKKIDIKNSQPEILETKMFDTEAFKGAEQFDCGNLDVTWEDIVGKMTHFGNANVSTTYPITVEMFEKLVENLKSNSKLSKLSIQIVNDNPGTTEVKHHLRVGGAGDRTEDVGIHYITTEGSASRIGVIVSDHHLIILGSQIQF
ncbi:hypothetical protein GCK72_011367 [Caenorhabditis remanei]|uniref:DUF38 domain-containing protein n=1 Tax=Caenorhabditis remanei TaxID=31234 RepID=A0A6A5H9M1_CAERE|nr:hypothetical protein GCK72_011367 [Caenorhabditis remanei]KAF1763102.1 hypothetical protein GCK72_011367 [Caenorhabditis remanei]